MRGARLVAAVGIAGGVAAATGWVRGRGRRRWDPPSAPVVDGPLPARVTGHGEPVLVLLHGMFNSGRYWGAAYERLGVGRVVAPDLLGFGRGPRPSDGYTADAHANAVADTLRHLGVDGPVIVAGHSIGSLVAMRLAIQHPDLVAALVAFSPPIYRDRASAQDHIRRVDPLARLLLANPELAARACALMCAHRDVAAAAVRALRPTLPAPLAEDRVEHSWASYSQTLANLVLAAEAGAWLAELTVPVRILAGIDDDALDHDHLVELADRHAHVTLDQAPGGHDLPLAAPEPCLAAIRDALADLNSRPNPGGR